MLKRLMNQSESVTDKRLCEICDDFDARVYPKIRVADVFEIEGSGIDDRHYSYALKAHFDFVVADSSDLPILAVEFDGSGHSKPEAQKRDEMKNALCDRFELPLLRIKRQYLTPTFSTWDLLGWFCTVFFIKRSWDEDVEAGKIAPDDSFFDPMFVSVVTKSGSRSLELERHARVELGKLFRSGLLKWHVPNWMVAKGGNGELRAIAWIEVSDKNGVVVDTAMQQQRVGSWVDFAIRGIVISMLQDGVAAVVDNAKSAVSMSSIKEKVKKFEGQYSVLWSFGSG